MVMVLLDTGPTLYKLMAKSVIATVYGATSDVGPTLFSPRPFNDLN